MGLAQRSLARTVKSLRSLRDSPAGLVVTAQMWEDIPRIATYLSDLEALIKAAKKRAAEDIVRARITAMAVTQPGEYNDNSIGELIDAARRDGAKTKARFQQRDEQRAAARRRKRAGDAQKHWRLIHDRLVRTEVGDVGTFQAAKELMVELKRIEGEQRAAEIAASEEKPR
jgi:hypothetical protein